MVLQEGGIFTLISERDRDDMNAIHMFIKKHLEPLGFAHLPTPPPAIVWMKRHVRAGPRYIDGMVINLHRRPERWMSFSNHANAVKLAQAFRLDRFPAIDGLTLQIAPRAVEYYPRFDTNYRKKTTMFHSGSVEKKSSVQHEFHKFVRGVLGCALSHYEIWQNLVANSSVGENDFIAVIEDDARFVPDVALRWQHMEPLLSRDVAWGVLWLGYLDDRQVYGDSVVHQVGVDTPEGSFLELEAGGEQQQIYKFSDWPRTIGGGTHAYIIRKKAARTYLATADTEGMPQAVDWFMINHFGHKSWDSYIARPHLAFNSNSRNASDIWQADF